MLYIYLVTQKGTDMKQKLLPIYDLRMQLLQKLNPKFYAENADTIRRSSLAAQDYFLSGTYREYDDRMGTLFKKLPGYISVHKKYKLPYNPSLTTTVNPALVMDLAWSLRTDMINGVVDANGNIKSISLLPQSRVLHVYHNTKNNGMPINALFSLNSLQLEQMLIASQKRTR